MKTMWIVVGVIVLISALSRALAKNRQSRIDPLQKRWPLEPKRYLLSERERLLFQRLREALPDHVVLAQVQLIQLLNFERGKWTQALFNRISQMSVDFVVLRPDTSVVAAIELDDASHDRDDRRNADARKTHALFSAGVQLVRWNVKSLPDKQAITAAIFPRIG